MGPRNHILDGVQIPVESGNFDGEKGRPIVKYWDTLRSSVQKWLNQIPFGLWARMGRRNHVLDGGPAVLRDVAMATNFGTISLLSGFV